MIYQWRIDRNRINRLCAAAALLGYIPPAAGFKRDYWVKLIHPEDLAKVEERVSAALERGDETYQVEYRLRHRNGDYQMVREEGWVERDEGGQARCVLCRVTGFAERDRVEEVSRESDEHVRQILEAAEVGAWQWDFQSGVFACYGRTLGLLGIRPEEFAGTYDAFLMAAHPDGRAAIDLAVKRTIETGAEFRVEFRVIQSNMPQADARWLLAKGNVRTNAQGAPERMMGIIYDITPHKQVEEARQELLAREQAARIKAEANARAKDEFLAVISHELRTPLSAMLGWAEMLRSRRPGDPIYERALQTIERNAERQSKLIEDLLDTTRILSGKLSIEARPLYLDALLEESLDVVRPTAEAKDIELIMTFDSAPGLILGDANRLQQVFWNLLSNAIKFTDPGGRVEARLERSKTETRIIVSDTGKGITPDFLPYVFDLFRQADHSSARRQGGIGLGLALAKRLVEMHGGAIKAESAGEGMGAIFTVTLPMGSGDRAVPEMNTIDLNKGLDASDKPTLAGLRILVVDDEADARDLLAIRLQQYGADVITAASARAALESLALQKPHPDLIVSDIAMPGEDGYSLIRQVRAMEPEQGGRIPAIAVTAYSRATDRMQALAAGFQMHVPKPVNAAELAQAIAGIVGQFGY
jgi:PAS domain S-box-containing protein